MIIQTKLFESKTLEEINQKINGFYVELSLKGGKVVKTQFINRNPYIMQLIYLVKRLDNDIPKKPAVLIEKAALATPEGIREVCKEDNSEIPDLSLEKMEELKEEEDKDRCTGKTTWGARCKFKAAVDGLCAIHLRKKRMQESKDAEETEEKQYEIECECGHKAIVGEEDTEFKCPGCGELLDLTDSEEEVDSEADVAEEEEEEEELIDEIDDEESQKLAEEHFKGKKKKWKTPEEIGEKKFKKTLDKHEGNVTRTAKELGMNYQSAWRYSRELKFR